MMLNMSGRPNSATADENGRKTWRWMLVDSAIIGAISLFTELIAGPPTWMGVYKAAAAFGLAFFIQLAVERGLKRPQPTE